MTENKKTWRATLHNNISQMCLMLALFFNPFGFDAIQYSLILWTGNLWKANLVMYFIAASFLGLYFYFRRCSNRN